jgi:hypothetical protein
MLGSMHGSSFILLVHLLVGANIKALAVTPSMQPRLTRMIVGDAVKPVPNQDASAVKPSSISKAESPNHLS